MKQKLLFKLQSVVLLAGTVFAGYTVYVDFARFYFYEGTVFKVKDCFLPNPVTTPCFYGGIAFLIALIWSISIYRMKPQRQSKHQKWLVRFLIAGTVFAWSVFADMLFEFYGSTRSVGVSCSGVLYDNPFETACFIGSVIFLAALIVAQAAKQRLQKV